MDVLRDVIQIGNAGGPDVPPTIPSNSLRCSGTPRPLQRFDRGSTLIPRDWKSQSEKCAKLTLWCVLKDANF